MKLEIAQKILEETKRNFDQIAEEFSATRRWPWEILKNFINYLKEGDKILDIGCGNGRLYELLKDKQIEYIGIDNSQKLIEIAKKRFQVPSSKLQVKFLVTDALDLPFKENEFDAVFMIAVLPHIPLKELQIKVLKEAWRVLKIDGYFFITCWNFLQPKLFFRNFLNRIKNPKLYQGFGFKDFLTPWKTREGKTIFRFYHAFFGKKELKNLLKKTGFEVKEIYYEKKGEKSNWLRGYNLVAIAKKFRNSSKIQERS